MGETGMSKNIPRREFLTVAPALAGALTQAVRSGTLMPEPRVEPAGGKVTGFPPTGDYPIRPKRFAEVKLTDGFWKPKITTNAEVTIPFEVRKLTEPGK